MDDLRIKPLEPLLAEEPARRGEDPADCPCAQPTPAEQEARVAWSNERWVVSDAGMKLMVAVAAAIESLPSVGRCHVGRYGDGGAHLHPFFFGRPARMGQLRGSCVLDWEENLPDIPDDVRRANAAHVGRVLVERLGGSGPAWEA